jgi:hypothetical protein
MGAESYRETTPYSVEQPVFVIVIVCTPEQSPIPVIGKSKPSGTSAQPVPVPVAVHVGPAHRAVPILIVASLVPQPCGQKRTDTACSAPGKRNHRFLT